MSKEVTEDQLKEFEGRISKRSALLKVEEAAKAEKLRQDYLRRTGRKEMKP